MLQRVTAVSAALVIASLGIVSAENWPHWRGPTQNGVSSEKNLPLKWSAQEGVTWKLPLPNLSGSTPIVWGDSIFLSVAESAAEGAPLSLWCVNRGDGSLRWKKPMDTGNHQVRKGDMTSPSPVTDGRTVWLLTGTGVIRAFDFNGTTLWTRDLQKDYGRFGLNHGYGSSPLPIDGDLVVQVLHGMHTDDPSYVLRIDGKTGQTKWRVERPTDAIRESPDSYTTPTAARQGKAVEIVVTGGDVVTGHDPATGKELWRSRGLNPENNPFNRIIASPLVVDGIVFAPTRVKPLLALRVGGRGDVTDTHRLWTLRQGAGCADTGVRRHQRLHHRRPRRGALSRREDRRGSIRSGAAEAGHLQLVAGAGRGTDLHHERGRPDVGFQGGPGLRAACGEPARRIHARVGRAVRRPDIHSHGEAPVHHRLAREVEVRMARLKAAPYVLYVRK